MKFLNSSPWYRKYASVNWVSIGSGNGLPPVWCQAITWTSADLLLIRPRGTTVIEIGFKIQNFSFKKMQLKILSAKWRPFCPGRDELIVHFLLWFLYFCGGGRSSVVSKLFMAPVPTPILRIFRQVTHNFNMIINIFTRLKHNFTQFSRTLRNEAIIRPMLPGALY